MPSDPATVELDSYVVDVLMRDLAGHDQAPSAFIVYVYFAVRSEREMTPALAASYRTIASATGLSKSAVQQAVARLTSRRLISASKTSPTATPRYRLHRHWRLRARRDAKSGRSTSARRETADGERRSSVKRSGPPRGRSRPGVR